MAWEYRCRSCSDWSYVFYEKRFDTEQEARAAFDAAAKRARESGGAGSLHQDGVQMARFVHWCPND